ncbi:low-molecular weight cobalt-containing nitrile hydratase subunit alpha [Octadecabacter antarcticus 307]|uniref:Low-molecular weight cobalt-containing nitrile hydratase subunit alpha n=1 Tax=Octadecabacter antarcticus 307 TaxID=391626 RepID=M9R6F8_9RHOB|nr:nitrile hydratase subunit alpha [Octadecabacter antarcticus]AGI67807.1 low-molecular weight cobalt-containing nitrile hydratase subunit alpha [Octadecabacter antarcticus 307]
MPHDHHDHPSPSGHPYRADDDAPLSYWQVMEIAVRELLVEKGITTASEIASQIDLMDTRSPSNGAQVVARAWCDPKFHTALMNDSSAATRAMGFDIGALKLIAIENTNDVHNMIVCTLCSCYPRNLLGVPPDWYKSRAYRSRTVREPRSVLAEFGVTLPDTTQIRVHDSTADMRYIVIPNRPEGTEIMSQNGLVGLVTRDSMIGTGLAITPSPVGG